MPADDTCRNESVAHDLAKLYIEKTYNFDKATPETYFKLYHAIYEKVLNELNVLK